tara:strand:+ start:1360 stop:1614 length:255 start_codon:yes stop_codon:yes gene_type:complete
MKLQFKNINLIYIYMNNVEKKRKKKKKCAFCNSKIKNTLIDIKCRCGKSFCITHLLPELHKCEYDYTQDKVKLDKIVNDKINKI